MPDHKIGSREEWQAARDELAKLEAQHAELGQKVTEQRRQLPWVPVEKEYAFATESGTRTLAELFDGRSQLVIYNFMFGPEYEAGCPVCSSIADNLNANVPHLRARDATLICSSRAALDKLQSYEQRMGWSFDWVSTVGPDFNRDLGFLRTQEELQPFLAGEMPVTVDQMATACGTDVAHYVAEGPGLSAYVQSDGTVYRTYVSTARGLEPVMGYYGLLDRAPMGRHEEGEEVHWLRRHDEYGS